MRVHRVVLGLVIGLIVGSVVAASHNATALRVALWLEPVGTLWVNAIRMTIVPLVVSLLFVSVAGRENSAGLGRLGAVTLATFIGLLLCAAAFAFMLAPPLMDDMKLMPDAAAALRAGVATTADATASQVKQLPTFAAWVTSLVPSNVVKAAADGAMLPLIIFTLLLALATRRLEASLRASLVGFFRAVGDATTRIVDWIIAVAPIGIFALVVVAASRIGIALAGAMGYYVLAISAALGLFALLTYPIAVMIGRVRLPIFTRAVLPAQAVALSSSSSLASLPALVEGGRAMELPPTATGFVLPLAVSTFKVATPITWSIGTLFLARLYGVELGPGAVASLAGTAVLLSLSIPGVPQGALLLLAPVLVTYGIPAEGVGLLLAADTIPDLVGTMTNVTGDLVAATVASRLAEQETEEGEPLAAGEYSGA